MLITESRRQFQITQDHALTLRLASRFAWLASFFDAEVTVSSHDRVANGKRVLDLLSLVTSPGDWIDLKARGADADVAVASLSELVASWYADQ